VTAVLAAAARAVLGAVLFAAAAGSLLWVAYGPQGLWTVAWLGVTAVVVAGCGVALEWLGKRHRGARR
jgi:CDP-diglyceride synthetase